jgi:hypothetical protein
MPSYRSLGEAAEYDHDIRGALLAHTAHTEAVSAISSLGYDTTESSVRRWRAQLSRPDTASYDSPYPDDRRHEPVAHRGPTGWTPGVTITDDEVEIRTPFSPIDAQPVDARKLLEDAGLDPDEWSVPKITTHQTYDLNGDPKLSAVWLRAIPGRMDVPSETEINEILDRYPVSGIVPSLSDGRILMIPSGDLQLGKSERGGTEATIERFARYTQMVAADLISSSTVETIVLPWLGDCIEGIVSQHGKNIAMLDRTITEQVMIYWRLMYHQIATFAPLCNKIIVPVVPGNHDQTTREQIMPHTDSWAITGAAAAADIIQGRAGYEHVSFAFPAPGEPHLALNVGTDATPLTLGFTHGHVTGGNPAKVLDWWKGQSHGRQQVGEADILVSAHWHHLRIEFTGGGRTWVQIPAMDGGSGWYRYKTGEDVVSGQITMELTPGQGCGWTNLRVYS